ncbi:hypothetical protein GCM10012275_23260 [Longimycelium tulufanense]|uniref:DUF1707 domain-containing protein n=1 Tax=Longimycelium tulufanense TaxID=907463 RepID=A0A8J3CC40_9PSEU|nr:DUF1707 domain-containing protein [Longimycelium tulufanense]GGM51712.1 hypothetical protein GCM10012275_23260 [Longimycelium tulufanense]
MSDLVHPDDQRVSDADRKAMQDTLRQAHEAGLIDLAEFDDRTRVAWAARTRRELNRLLADLPAAWRDRRPARNPGRTAMKVLAIIWAALSAVNLTIWVLVGITVEWVHPWWVWVAGPPGAVLAVLWGIGIGRKRGPEGPRPLP